MWVLWETGEMVPFQMEQFDYFYTQCKTSVARPATLITADYPDFSVKFSGFKRWQILPVFSGSQYVVKKSIIYSQKLVSASNVFTSPSSKKEQPL